MTRQATEADKHTSGADDRGARLPRSAALAAGVERATTARAPLFTVSNRHTAACGEPPAVDGDAPGTYVGYFANEYGEQAIYTYDYETGAATLRMGDAGWHDARRVAARPGGGAPAHQDRGAVAALMLARHGWAQGSPHARYRRRASSRLRGRYGAFEARADLAILDAALVREWIGG